MRSRIWLFVGLLAFFASAGLNAQVGEVFSGEVVGITDGDTIRVMHGGEAVRVRLEGIDAPESAQDFSQRAKQLTSSLTFHKVVRVDVRDVDRYGRLVARVAADGQDVSVTLVEQGLAWHYTQYSSDLVLAQAQQAARAAGVGLWSRPNPIPPWDFRRGDTAAVNESTDGHLHGNRRSRVFHRPGCPNYNCPNCTVLFDSPEDAVAAGFRPAGDCHDLASQGVASTQAHPQVADTDGPLHGNRRSQVFHKPGCRNYSCKNCTVVFRTHEEAVAAGFRPAGDCHR